jgi:two-component system CheB/CheR fusion protein
MAKKKQTARKAESRQATEKGRRKKPPAKKKTAAAVSPAAPAPEAVANDAGKLGLTVVGVGASAGGLDAFQQLLVDMPGDTGMAFVLIQHLAPMHESLTAELLDRHTAMPVVQVVDEMRVEPNHVYVIPPNRYLTISGQTLHLTEPIQRRGMRVPIDFFFRSLAEEQHERAIAIVLSGTGTDGTLGVREIKAAGGMVMVQAPETTQFDGMLRSAVGTGVVDYVLPIEKMPDVLTRYVQHWYVNGTGAPAAVAEKAPDDLNTIVGLLRARIKYDFSCYKKGTLTRRIQRRMGLSHIEDMGEYVELLRQEDEEISALYKDLLIGVTNFFREPQSWQALQKHVVAPLVDEHDDNSAIRVWVPGCATGEEAYSMAMLLSEQLQAADKSCAIQLFASDIDQDALAFARAGIYPETVAADVTPERLRHFFIKGEHTHRINKEIREAMVFAQQNLIGDPPFSKLDLISCRNLLIYLEPKAQQKILALFHFALRPGGYLFLGGSETIGQQHDLSQTISRKWRIYRRIGPTRLDKIGFPVEATDASQLASEMTPETDAPRPRGITALAQQLVLKRFAPACALINRKAEVLYLSGPIDQYLQLPTGEPAPDVMAMARDGLRTKLRSAVHRAIRHQQPVNMAGLRVKRERQYFPVRLTVEPLQQPRQAEGLLLISFEETDVDLPTEPGAAPEPDSTEPSVPTAVESLPASDHEAVVHQLEDELRTTREDLQSTVEELETSNEEFKAANEEVTSINEELQSTNEELETSKEELQSLNEELQTVNSQLEQKVAEVESTNNDLSNLLASTDIATVFLDRRFCIKRFTPVTTRLFRVVETDVGRPISDFAQNFHDAALLTDAQHVLEDLATVEKQVQSEDGRSYIRRIMPYRTEDNRIDGVLIAFVDITDRVRAEQAGQEAQLYAEGIVATVREPLLVLDAEMRVQSANRSFYATFETTPQNTENRPLHKLGDGQWDIPRLRELLQQVLAEHRAFEDFEVEHEFPGMGRRTMLLNARAVSRDGDCPDLILLAIEDVTVRKQAELQLQSLNEQLEQRVADRTAEAEKRSHELAEQQRLLHGILDSTGDGVLACDLAGKFLLFNAAGRRLVGVDPADLPVEKWSEHFGLHLPDQATLCPSDDLPLVRAMHGEVVRDQEIFLCNPKWPEGIWLSVSANPLHDEGGAVLGGVCVFRDIGERKRFEQQLAELTNEERQKVGQQLHDSLGQQITGIGMIASSLKKQVGNQSPQAETAGKLESSVEAAQRQLRTLAKGLFPVAVDAHGLAVALETLAHETAEMHQLECDFECPDPVPLENNFIATELYLIAREAVHNAAKHGGPSRIVVRLQDHDEILLVVSDDGKGVPANVEESRGMGIRIMRHRAALVGGTLAIESPPDGGTHVSCSVRAKHP